MFTKMRHIPDRLGDISGVEFDADIPVRITTNKKLRNDVIQFLEGAGGREKVNTISLNNTYKIIKITAYGDCFDATIINDLGQEEDFGEWFFEDIDED